MNSFYSDNKNQQILLALLKAYGLKKVVVSPGGTNPALVISMQHDGSFELFSCVDERSAAYMACGLSSETEEPVALCCTGATASRNYMSALTEAYYRKLPILAITCSRPNYNLGHLMPQVTNRNIYPADIVTDGEHLQVIKDEKDFWDVEFKINRALISLKNNGGGPVHINVETTTQSCTTQELPAVKLIKQISPLDEFPIIESGKVCVFIGSHKRFSKKETVLMESFCEKYNAIILKDHTSGYYGKYSVLYSLIGTQKHKYEYSQFDLIIHIGEISGDYLTFEHISAKNVWRVSDDGALKIRFSHLDYSFKMPEELFFMHYSKMKNNSAPNLQLYNDISSIYEYLYSNIPSLPLSHIYVAHRLAPIMPLNCVIHFAILNALRSWNFFKLDNSIRTSSNVGGFGIDGCMSSLIGASLADPSKLYFLFTGDLSFFYDLNSLGNRHIKNNIRILILNDGRGAEFCHYMFPKYSEDTNLFVAGAGHFGNQSVNLVKNYAEDLGFEYMQVVNEETFDSVYKRFISPELTEKPMILEIIASTKNQSDSWKLLSNIQSQTPKERLNHIIKVGTERIKSKLAL